MDSNRLVVSVVCQWCERVIRQGESGQELVTCLRCAQSFGANFHHAGIPVVREMGSSRTERELAGSR